MSEDREEGLDRSLRRAGASSEARVLPKKRFTSLILEHKLQKVLTRLMEVVGSTAAVSQLLDQVITIVQEVRDARPRAYGESARLDGYKDQVAYSSNSGAKRGKQYTHVLISGEREEKDLNNAMTGLDRAKVDLTARIITAHVGLNGAIRTGFAAAFVIIQRDDRNVQKVLGERLTIAAWLEGLSPDGDSSAMISLTGEDAKVLNLVEKVSWVKNKAFDGANMVTTRILLSIGMWMRRVLQLSFAHAEDSNMIGLFGTGPKASVIALCALQNTDYHQKL
ncbi:uncharacterized protein BDR25DRAFT_353834 [Lindgomyces ingoldianus]|uniref:Uncharacterized protein n=1 Tax=Lindgomyces ingoldianus TaxID=673940 RepID=A0ACB6QYK1_9PLEO|nr:uncharacterized protein BDR25DRAFT_353834 [Lindgomyces ingoldianus]KAF2472098.1 hypothetical protein BDR25DRAFT_353834 [Lindgomyces ingoldianus]